MALMGIDSWMRKLSCRNFGAIDLLRPFVMKLNSTIFCHIYLGFGSQLWAVGCVCDVLDCMSAIVAMSYFHYKGYGTPPRTNTNT